MSVGDGSVGELAGGIIGMALFGAALSWLLRWGLPIQRPVSIVLALCLFSPVAGFLKSSNGSTAFLSAWLFYAACGLFAALLLLVSDRPRRVEEVQQMETEFERILEKDLAQPVRRRGAIRILGFVGVTVCGAIGGGMMMAALRSYSDGPVLASLSLLFLIPGALILRSLIRTEDRS